MLRVVRIVAILLGAMAVGVSAQAQTPAPPPEPVAQTSIVIARQELRFTSRDESLEWRLVVTNQQDQLLFDSGVVYGPSLTWSLKNLQDAPLPTGLYAYTLTTRALTQPTATTQQGHVIVNRASDNDRVWLTSNQPFGVGADGVTPQVSASFSRPLTVGGAELPGAPPRAQAAGKPTGPTSAAAPDRQVAFPPITSAMTANRVAKFAGDGTLTDSAIADTGSAISVGGTASLGAMTLIGNVPNGDAPAMALYNQGGGAGASVAIDFYNTLFNGGIPQAKIKAVDDGAYSDHLTFFTKVPGAENNPVVERVRITSTGEVGIGTAGPSARLHVSGGNLLFDNLWRTEGTTVNTPAVTGPPNLIGGFLGTFTNGAWTGNGVTAGAIGATIGGGGFYGTTFAPDLCFNLCDYRNRVTDLFGTIGGGAGNRAGNDTGTVEDAPYATVAGGRFNIANGYESAVGGGRSNSASGDISFVGGGANNSGTGPYSAVLGGYVNTASGFLSTTAGGMLNTASGANATAMGGTFNTASGTNATAMGGDSNTASGSYSFAAGRRAKAIHDGAFVWADSTNADFQSAAADTFNVRAAGGMRISGSVYVLQAATLFSNALLPNTSDVFDIGSTSFRYRTMYSKNGVLQTSDIRAKRDVRDLGYGLREVMRLRPVSFLWKDQDTRERSLGLIAQEVEAVVPEVVARDADPAHPLGMNYAGLMPVVIKSIQEQQATIEQLAAENSRLKDQNQALESRLAALEQRLK